MRLSKNLPFRFNCFCVFKFFFTSKYSTRTLSQRVAFWQSNDCSIGTQFAQCAGCLRWQKEEILRQEVQVVITVHQDFVPFVVSKEFLSMDSESIKSELASVTLTSRLWSKAKHCPYWWPNKFDHRMTSKRKLDQTTNMLVYETFDKALINITIIRQSPSMVVT